MIAPEFAEREAVAPAVRELVDALAAIVVFYTAEMADTPANDKCWNYIRVAQDVIARYRRLLPDSDQPPQPPTDTR